jgi:molecular chaperone GrpE
VDENAKPEPQVRVVDRRWWARDEGDASGPAPGSTKPTYVEELERQLADKSARLQSAFTEFEQVKTRLRRDTTREVERSRRAVLVEMLDVLDNLDRALASAAERSADDPLVRGVALVRDQFVAKLDAFGVRRIDALDRPFDAAAHEAVSTAAVTDGARDGVVVAVVRDGYTIGDELLRPAAVVVGQRAANG